MIGGAQLNEKPAARICKEVSSEQRKKGFEPVRRGVGDSDKKNISTKQSTNQNIFFTLYPYLIQNKYVPHKINSPPRSQAPLSLRTFH
jgi:hypothetical protein